MKTKEELNALKEEVETVSRKLHELTEEELAQVAGGLIEADTEIKVCPFCGTKYKGIHVCDWNYVDIEIE